jgi:hypothetical protein
MMVIFRNLLSTLFLCILFAGFGASAQAQSVQVLVKTYNCGMGRVYHPIHVNVSIFDAEKIPEIMKLVKDLKLPLGKFNSDVDADKAVEKAEKLYDQLQKMVAATPALARSKSIPTSEHTFSVPLVRRIVVFGFEKSEYEEFPYAVQELDISSEHANTVTLDFSAEEDVCNKNVK